MSDYAPGSLRSIAVMRAPTWMERLNDAVRDVYESAAKQPAIRVLDMLGLSDIAGVADDLNRPNTGLRMGIMPEGPGKTLKEIGKGIRAFHGSPYDFEKFDLSKIGTGEGAQAYGHGLYFAEQPAVAKEYQNKLTAASDALIGGRPVSDVKRELLASARDVNKADEAYAKLRFLESLEEIDAGKDGLSTPSFDEALRFSDPSIHAWAKSLKGQYTLPKGRMYEVRIHADPEQFLDWDKPLSQQPHIPQSVKDAVQEGIDKELISRRGSLGTGETAYSALRMKSDPVNYSPQAASEALKKSGIPGIKYLDQGSRTSGEGTRNYVVFDDKLIEIVKKYGIAAALGAGLINEGQARQLQMQGHQ